MKPETLDLLRSLDELEWFQNVGSHDDVADLEGVIWIESWDDAVAHATSPYWHMLRTDAKNLMSRQIMGSGVERFREYSRVQQEIYDRVFEMVSRKIASLMAERGLPDTFLRSVAWDILVGALECEFADIVDPGIPGVILEGYKLGHLPCGMDDDTGNLMVF